LQIRRPNPQSDFHDLGFVTYECPDGLLWNHQTICAPDHGPTLVCNVHGSLASAPMCHYGKSFLRGGPLHYGGGHTGDQHVAAAVRNIAAFHQRDQGTAQQASRRDRLPVHRLPSPLAGRTGAGRPVRASARLQGDQAGRQLRLCGARKGVRPLCELPRVADVSRGRLREALARCGRTTCV
jgi:hypothetical protein